ncbi:WXG100 family type VII secretion target [Nocardia sp. CA-145437]|uniref:WXG100 family type VII secretion target n=1 Tax=Nocardia sp. CA-145437 TaxID=3239980 RepID=UPI003D981ABB
MTNKVRVEVAGMRSTANDLDSAASALDTVKAAFDAAVKAGDGSWGADQYGSEFTAGDGGYTKRQPILADTLVSMSQRLRAYSSGLQQGANKFDETEQVNADGFKS